MQGECRGKRVSLLTLRPCRAATCLRETKISQGECRGKRVSLLTLRPCRAAACLRETKIVRIAHTARHHPPHRARRPCTKPVTRRENPSDTAQKLRTVGGQSKYASCEYINESFEYTFASLEYTFASLEYTFATCVYTLHPGQSNFASHQMKIYVPGRQNHVRTTAVVVQGYPSGHTTTAGSGTVLCSVGR